MKTKKSRLKSILFNKFCYIRCAFFSIIVFLNVASAGIVFADDANIVIEPANNLESKKELVVKNDANKSYLIPAAEIVGFDILLNQFTAKRIFHKTFNILSIESKTTIYPASLFSISSS